MRVRFNGKEYVIIFTSTFGRELRLTKLEMSELISRVSAIREYCEIAGYPPIEYDENFNRVGGYTSKEKAIDAGYKDE